MMWVVFFICMKCRGYSDFKNLLKKKNFIDFECCIVNKL